MSESAKTTVGLLLAAAAAGAALGGCSRGGGERGASKEDTLVVISPHDEMIRYEIDRAFESYALGRWGRRVTIRWQPARGTGNIMRYLENEMKSAASGREVGIDVLLGGGAPAHEKAKGLGITRPVDLDAAILGAVPQSLAGVALYDPDRHWYGITLNSFGIIYNRRGLAARGLPEPSSWKDLADPAFFDLLTLADPFESGSARACYEMILQKYGWDEGWGILLRAMGNAGGFTHSASDIAKEISAGQSVAGMVIDTYAFVQIEQDGADLIGFTLPQGETTFTPDPVSVIKGTGRLGLARRFIEFLLSPEGQAIWLLPAGSPGGPEKHNLWHFPVLPEVYRAHKGGMLIEESPFESFASLKYDEKKGNKRSRLLTLLFTAAAVENRAGLKAAWKEALGRPGGAAGTVFARFPLDEAAAMKKAESIKDSIDSERVEEELYRLFKEAYLRSMEGK